MKSGDGIPTGPQIVLGNLVFQVEMKVCNSIVIMLMTLLKDFVTDEVKVLVEVEGWDDSRGAALRSIQTLPDDPIEVATAHVQRLILWRRRHIEMDSGRQASFQVRHQDFLHGILRSLEGVDEKVVDPTQERKFKPLHHVFHRPPVIFGMGA